MAFAEDLSPFMDPAGFAVPATWLSPVVGQITPVNGIFDDGHAEAFSGFAAETKPSFMCAASDVPSVAKGDSLTINDTHYQIASVEPDGTGMVTLQLELA